MKLFFLAAAVSAVVFGVGSAAAQAPAAAQPPSCSAREYRQFDFWIGDWDVLAPDGTRAGQNRVEASDGGRTWSVAFDGKYVRAQKPAARQGVVYKAPSGITLRLMLDDTNVGDAVSLGEMTFPSNLDSGDHAHGAIEMFYVLSGELEHV